jgi:hypothetical protein
MNGSETLGFFRTKMTTSKSPRARDIRLVPSNWSRRTAKSWCSFGIRRNVIGSDLGFSISAAILPTVARFPGSMIGSARTPAR